jgi:hypothetical protein
MIFVSQAWPGFSWLPIQSGVEDERNTARNGAVLASTRRAGTCTRQGATSPPRPPPPHPDGSPQQLTGNVGLGIFQRGRCKSTI